MPEKTTLLKIVLEFQHLYTFCSTSDIAFYFNVSPDIAFVWLQELQEQGLITQYELFRWRKTRS